MSARDGHIYCVSDGDVLCETTGGRAPLNSDGTLMGVHITHESRDVLQWSDGDVWTRSSSIVAQRRTKRSTERTPERTAARHHAKTQSPPPPLTAPLAEDLLPRHIGANTVQTTPPVTPRASIRRHGVRRQSGALMSPPSAAVQVNVDVSPVGRPQLGEGGGDGGVAGIGVLLGRALQDDLASLVAERAVHVQAMHHHASEVSRIDSAVATLLASIG